MAAAGEDRVLQSSTKQQPETYHKWCNWKIPQSAGWPQKGWIYIGLATIKTRGQLGTVEGGVDAEPADVGSNTGFANNGYVILAELSPPSESRFPKPENGDNDTRTLKGCCEGEAK